VWKKNSICNDVSMISVQLIIIVTAVYEKNRSNEFRKELPMYK
jgi:hypothetical protein